MNKKLWITITLYTLLTACAEPQQERVYNLKWEAIDGSHANGTMKLSARIRSDVTFYTNIQQADKLAAQRCQSWNYQNAEAFSRPTKRCLSVYQGTNVCALWEFMRNYQCTTRQTDKETSITQDVWNIKPQQ